MISSYFFLWLPMIAVAFVNATIRELIFTKHFSKFRSQQISTLTLIIFCTIYVWFVYPYLHFQNKHQPFITGGIWVVLTVLFEFALGKITKHSWNEMLQQYNIGKGNIWPLFLLWLFLLPYMVYLLSSKFSQ